MYKPTPTPIHLLPKGKKPGRNRSGVKTEWGKRNTFFQLAKQTADPVKRDKFIAQMEGVQALSKRERKILRVA